MADDAAPAEQDQPINAPEAPETDQPEGAEEESFTDFDLSEVPEEARPAVEAAEKRMQADYTRKTQTLAEERREAEQARQLVEALRNPQVAPAVLANLGYDERKMLEMYGYQPGEEEPEEEPDLYDRLARVEGTLSEREAAEQIAQREEAVTDYISGEIEKLEQKAGREFDANAQRLLDAYARQYAQNGVPDVQGAYELLSGLSKAEEKALLDPKRNVSRPPGGGKPGSRTVDLSKETNEERLARMANAVDQAQASGQ